MENENTSKKIFVLRSIQQLKHCLVWIVFGIPIIAFGLNIFIWVILYKKKKQKWIFSSKNDSPNFFTFHFQPDEWNNIISNPKSYLTHLDWCSIVPLASKFYTLKTIFESAQLENFSMKFLFLFSAFMLVLAEAYAKEMKTFKYYHCATLIIYESIGLLTIFAYIQAMIRIFPNEQLKKIMQNQSLSTILQSIYGVIYIILISSWIGVYWLKNTYVHFSLLSCRIHEVSINLQSQITILKCHSFAL